VFSLLRAAAKRDFRETRAFARLTRFLRIRTGCRARRGVA
jgi:hypothetical protein